MEDRVTGGEENQELRRPGEGNGEIAKIKMEG